MGDVGQNFGVTDMGGVGPYNFGMGQKNGFGQNFGFGEISGVGVNVLLFNHTL